MTFQEYLMSTRTPYLLRPAALLAAAMLQLAGAGAALAQHDDADRSYRSATGLLNRGMPELAAEEYRTFLKSNPNDKRVPTARYGLAVCLSRLGKHAEACEQLEQVVKVAGFEFAADAALLLGQSQLLADHAEESARTLGAFLGKYAGHKQADVATSLLGEALMRAGNEEEAAKTFAALAAHWPQSSARERADLLWSICDSNAGRVKEAAARLDSLLSRSPSGAWAAQATLLDAQCRHRLGEVEHAGTLYRAAADSADAGVKADAMLGIAQLTRAAGKPQDAQRLLEKLLAGPLSPATEPAARLELGRCRLDEGDAAAALADLDKTGAKVPASLADDFAYWASRCESKLGKDAEAAARLEGCDARYAKSELLPEMLYARADALTHSGRQEDADAVLVTLRTKFPDNPLAADALLSRAAAAYQAGDDATARRLSEEFLRTNPAHPRAATAELVIAECEYRADQFAEAEAAYGAFANRHPDDPNAWHATVRRGLCLSRLGKPAEAAAVLAPALRDAKAGDPALRRAATVALGDAAFAAGDWKNAEAWFGAVVSGEHDPNGSGDADVTQDALLKLGLSIHRQGRPEQAEQVYAQLFSQYPKSRHATQATFERGQALLDLKKDEEAGACFARVVESEKGTDAPRFTAYAKRHLAAIASRQGHAEEAARLLGEVAASTGDASGAGQLRLDQGMALLGAGEYAEAAAALEEASHADADKRIVAEARANHAIAISREGKPDEALKELEAAVAVRDEISPATRESIGYERASVLRELGRDDEASKAYTEFLAGSPSPRLATHASIELAQLCAKGEKFDDCLQLVDAAQKSAAAADEATRTAIGDHALYLRGLAQYRTGKNAEAVRTLSTLLKEHADSALKSPASLVCGEALLKANQPAEAARLFQDVAHTAKDADIAAPALLRLGEACAAAQNWTGSEQAFSEFLSRFLDSPVWYQARFGIGWARENQGRHDAAIESYREVVGKHDGPTAARAQFQIGECLFAMKKHDDAVKELLRVDILYAYPEWSAAALYEAGRCLREQNKQAEAREQFQQVVQRFPDSNWAKLATQLIDETKPASLPGRDRLPPASKTNGHR
jgi:TolA-binding protein